MTQQQDDASWAELGREWRAGQATAVDEAALRARLGRQRRLQIANICFEIIVAVVALGMACVLMAKRPGLGIAAFVFVLTTVGLGLWARSGKERGDLDSVAGMIELSISRAERNLRYVEMTYLICAVSLVFVACVMLMESLSSPPPLSPHREHAQWTLAGVLIYIAAAMLGALVYQRRTQRLLARFRKLRAELRGEPDQG